MAFGTCSDLMLPYILLVAYSLRYTSLSPLALNSLLDDGRALKYPKDFLVMDIYSQSVYIIIYIYIYNVLENLVYHMELEYNHF